MNYKILGLFDKLIAWINIATMLSCRSTKIFIIKWININIAFLSQTQRKICWAVSVWIQTRKIKQNSFCWLHIINIIIIMKLISIMHPFTMIGIIFFKYRKLSLFLRNLQHFPDPIWSLFLFNILKYRFVLFIVDWNSLLLHIFNDIWYYCI